MKICLIGNSITSLVLAKILLRKKINVSLFYEKKRQNFSKSRTIGISKNNCEFLANKVIRVTKKDLWKIGVDLSFVMNGCSNEIRGPLSILTEKDLLFDQDLMIGVNEKSKIIIEKIIDIYYKFRKFHVLIPGDCLIINNRRLVHGRSSFKPKFDGTDRFVIRSFILNNIEKVKNKTNFHNRMIGVEYS